MPEIEETMSILVGFDVGDKVVRIKENWREFVVGRVYTVKHIWREFGNEYLMHVKELPGLCANVKKFVKESDYHA